MSYADEQLEAWLNGGAEWYARKNNIALKPDCRESVRAFYQQLGGIPDDFDPHVFREELEKAS